MTIFKHEHLPLYKEAREVKNEDYKRYVRAHGYHMTDALADFGSRLLINADGTSHRWNTFQVRSKFYDYMLSKSDNHTWGDIAFLANRAYAIYYPTVIKDADECMKIASAESVGENGYKEMAFVQFVNDLIGIGIRIEWIKYV